MSAAYPDCPSAWEDLVQTQHKVGCYIFSTINAFPEGDDFRALLKSVPWTPEGTSELEGLYDTLYCLWVHTRGVVGYCEQFDEKEEESLTEKAKANAQLVKEELDVREIPIPDGTPEVPAKNSTTTNTAVIVGVSLGVLVLVLGFIEIKRRPKKPQAI